MSEFIKLTAQNGKHYIYPVRRIHLIKQFTDGDVRVYDEKNDYHYCKETPEEIMRLLDGSAETSAMPLVEGDFPDFSEPFEETCAYWQKRSQYWEVRSFYFQELASKGTIANRRAIG